MFFFRKMGYPQQDKYNMDPLLKFQTMQRHTLSTPTIANILLPNYNCICSIIFVRRTSFIIQNDKNKKSSHLHSDMIALHASFN